MRVHRICRSGFDTLDGEGARLNGGRWSTPRKAIVYTAGSLALAALEYLVHVDPEDVPGDLVALTIEIPDEIDPVVVSDGTLPGGWEQLADHPACKEAGDKWRQTGATLVLQVLAAPIPQESNYLLNPTHDEMRKVKVIHKRPFSFDPRLL